MVFKYVSAIVEFIMKSFRKHTHLPNTCCNSSLVNMSHPLSTFLLLAYCSSDSDLKTDGNRYMNLQNRNFWIVKWLCTFSGNLKILFYLIAIVYFLWSGGGVENDDKEGPLKFSFMQSHHLLLFFTIVITLLK